jgi:hypothetical protein
MEYCGGDLLSGMGIYKNGADGICAIIYPYYVRIFHVELLLSMRHLSKVAKKSPSFPLSGKKINSDCWDWE